MLNKYHANILAEVYCVSRSAILKRANKLGIKGSCFTIDEAFKIGFNNRKLEEQYIYPEDGIYPSKLNNTPLRKLPNWLKN